MIISEEMLIANKEPIESADQFMQLLEGKDEPFSGKVFLGLGDFRQVAPVVKGCGPTATYKASIPFSALWPHFEILRVDMVVHNTSDSEYSTWVDGLQDGIDVENPLQMKVTLIMIDRVDTFEDAIQFLFPATVLNEYKELSKQSFLSPLNVHGDNIELLLLSKFGNLDQLVD